MSSREEKQALLPVTESFSTPPRSAIPVRKTALLTALLASLVVLGWSRNGIASSEHETIKWTSCGSGLECGTLEVPLDWADPASSQKVAVALARLPASSKEARLGSLILNPGGPGGSGTQFVSTRGPAISKVVDGRYDIVGFDPRGINLTTPYVSCFPDKLSEHIFGRGRTRTLNLPVNFSSSVSIAPGSLSGPSAVMNDLEGQIRVAEATLTVLYQNCVERTGEAAAFMGTQSVVKDIDYLAQVLDGPDVPINYWGFSYGTVIGQYLTAILPPERLGKIVIDGVVDAEAWAGPSRNQVLFGGLDDIDRVIEQFASSCLAAKSNCSLAPLGSAKAILSALDLVIDQLYHTPVPVDLPVAGFVGLARHAKDLILTSAYRITAWPALADHFAEAHFRGNFTGLINATLSHLDGSVAKAAKQPDSSAGATAAIQCADSLPFNSTNLPPTSAEMASSIADALDQYSPRSGDGFWVWAFCHLWPIPSRSYFGGSFKKEPNAFDRPVLILSQRFDPVTPLGSAKKALKNLGTTNARLVEQNGSGHCSISQASLCTSKIVRKFFVEGVAPDAAHSYCEVDQIPFQEYNSLSIQSVEDRELLEAWSSVGEMVGSA